MYIVVCRRAVCILFNCRHIEEKIWKTDGQGGVIKITIHLLGVMDEGGVAGLQGRKENKQIPLHRPRNYHYISGFCFFNSKTFPGTENDEGLLSRIIAFRGTALNSASPSRAARQIERRERVKESGQNVLGGQNVPGVIEKGPRPYHPFTLFTRSP